MNTGPDSSRGELLAGLGLVVVVITSVVIGMIEAAGNGETAVIVIAGLVGTWWLIKGLYTLRLLTKRS